MNKQPEITKKTRQRFVDAFWSLAREKPIAKIAVSELTRRAGYNRSTFYEYFLDTDDLLDYIESSLLEQVKQTILQVSSEDRSPEDLFQVVFAAMNEKVYLLMGPNGDSSFFAKVKAELLPYVEEYFSAPEDLPNFDYLICFANSAIFGLLQHWNEQGKNLPAEEVSGMMQNLVLNGLQTYITPLPQGTSKDT